MIRVKVKPQIEQKFRELAMREFGYGKGALSRAAEEAILKWISVTEKGKIEFEGNPLEAVDGLLSDIEFDSVTLQHKIKDLWLQKVAENVPS